jgi:hypothetical protein
MTISQEFLNFVRNWQHKSEEYNTTNLRSCFDKFFTLYIVFNRIYAEATFSLARRLPCQFKTSNWTSFPDRDAATAHILQFMNAENFVSGIMTDENSAAALKEIIRLIRDERFYIKLDMVTGDQQRDRDLKLLADLEGNNLATKGRAILETIYCIRCNMFHGHKGFNKVQLELLQPIIIILEKTIKIAFDKLQGYDR